MMLLYFWLILTTSLISFTAYGFDKQWAKSGQQRVPERLLHLLAVLGGWPGAWLGQRVFRHKTQKRSFRLVFWLMIVLHISITTIILSGWDYSHHSPRR